MRLGLFFLSLSVILLSVVAELYEINFWMIFDIV